MTNAVSGGTNLVSRGLVATDSAAQGFGEAFFGKRHPRTAVGITTQGDLWFVVVDGRQSMSDGATIDELARVMQRLGCMEAINLDGGGSSTMNLFGQTLNRPSDGKEREVANAILFFGKADKPSNAQYALVAPQKAKVGEPILLSLKLGGQAVSNAKVLWTATGSGWIDQGGTLRLTKEGTVFVSAWSDGKVVSAGIDVAP